jgi:hypothetical protein
MVFCLRNRKSPYIGVDTVISFVSERKRNIYPLQKQICWCALWVNKSLFILRIIRNEWIHIMGENVDVIAPRDHRALKGWRKHRIYLHWAQMSARSEGKTLLGQRAISRILKCGRGRSTGGMMIFRGKRAEAKPSATSFTTNPTRSYPCLWDDNSLPNRGVAVWPA